MSIDFKLKNAATYLITFLLIFFLCPYKSAAQDIDGELKSYAALCDSCLMLKKSLSEGSTISPDKAKSLIGKFVETGKKLKSRSMSPWQKDMYRLITERFSSSSYTESFAAGIPVIPAMNCEITGANETTGIIARETNAQKTNAEETTRADKAEKPLRFSIIASVSFPYLTGGFMLGIQYNGWGGYIRGTTNFTKTESTYTCLSNGTLPDGSEFWGGGQNQLGQSLRPLTFGYRSRGRPGRKLEIPRILRRGHHDKIQYISGQCRCRSEVLISGAKKGLAFRQPPENYSGLYESLRTVVLLNTGCSGVLSGSLK